MEKYTFDELTRMQVSLIDEARGRVRNLLKKQSIEGLIVNRGFEKGKTSSVNDRSMYQWISTSYKGVEYVINFFYSEIDPNSGNCHSQIGRVMFTKGYHRNKENGPTSPNDILIDDDGQFRTNKNFTVVRFNSCNWVNPLKYFPQTESYSRDWISVDDLDNEDTVKNLVDAFITFVKAETDKIK